jgi:pyruvate formate lyase activating enzyme
VTRTGRLSPTVTFAHRLAERNTPMWIRFVLVPG